MDGKDATTRALHTHTFIWIQTRRVDCEKKVCGISNGSDIIYTDAGLQLNEDPSETVQQQRHEKKETVTPADERIGNRPQD